MEPINNIKMDIQEKTILFFKKWGIYDNKLKNETIINTSNQDFFDMEMIIESFFKECNISNNNGFNVTKYLYRIPFLNNLLIKLGFKIKIESKPPITISHMIEVAKRKEWFDPE